MIQAILLVVFGEAWSAIGQVLFKRSATKIGAIRPRDLASYWAFAKAVFLTPGILLGLGSMAMGLIIWLVALSKYDLSVVFPFGSTQYILILIASTIFLKEKLDFMKLLGTALVILGIVAVSFS